MVTPALQEEVKSIDGVLPMRCEQCNFVEILMTEDQVRDMMLKHKRIICPTCMEFNVTLAI